MGPNANAGIKLNAPTIMITPINHAMNSGVCVGRVPALSGIFFFCTSDPAIANVGTINQ